SSPPFYKNEAFSAEFGNDKNGRKILNYLKKYDFDLSDLKVLNGKTAVSYIKRINNDYKIYKVKQGVKGKYNFSRQDIKEIIDYDIVHTNIYSNTIDYLPILKKQNKLISFDFSFKLDFDLLDQYYKFIDILFVNGEKLSDETISVLKGFNIKLLIITYGKKGFLIINGNIKMHTKPQNDNIIDSIGAGDTLISTFLAGIYSNQDLETIAKNAEKNAYQSCLKLGPYHQYDDN
ncbi:MAG: PfkB family carbohydrate kinase, partial [Bacillota bacterium]